MSTFFDSMEDLTDMMEWPGMKEWSAMASEYERMMPKHFGGAANLMAHPMGAAAASAALGLGVASHAFGMWMGMAAGAAEAMQRASGADMPSPFPKPEAAKPAFTGDAHPAARTKAAVETLAADAESAAREAGRAIGETASKAAREAGDMAQGAVAAAAPVADAMPEDFVKPKPMARPASPDDLKAIAGIGPKLEQVLNDLGIWTYDQIAAWTPGEVAWVDDYLAFKGRIDRDGWVGQATTLGTKQ